MIENRGYPKRKSATPVPAATATFDFSSGNCALACAYWAQAVQLLQADFPTIALSSLRSILRQKERYPAAFQHIAYLITTGSSELKQLKGRRAQGTVFRPTDLTLQEELEFVLEHRRKDKEEADRIVAAQLNEQEYEAAGQVLPPCFKGTSKNKQKKLASKRRRNRETLTTRL